LAAVESERGFCKLIVETDDRRIVGAHVLGECSAEVIQMVAACRTACRGRPV
jgi:pyruvate/2-oxoglutarate dehydrogenase complex dihydrolipoamide dehydrogenase (E3) component